jgi:hypothetical protein
MLFSRMNAGNPAHLWRVSLGIFGLPRLARSPKPLLRLKVQLLRKRVAREYLAVSILKLSRMSTCAKFICNSSEMNTYKLLDLKLPGMNTYKKTPRGTAFRAVGNLCFPTRTRLKQTPAFIRHLHSGMLLEYTSEAGGARS